MSGTVKRTNGAYAAQIAPGWVMVCIRTGEGTTCVDLDKDQARALSSELQCIVKNMNEADGV